MSCFRHGSRRRGAIAVLILLVLIAMLAFGAFAIDTSYMQLVRTDLRKATDAAARAGMEALTRTDDVALARQAAKDVAKQNNVANEPLVLEDDQIIFGRASQSNDGSWRFDAGVEPFNSLRVSGERTKDSAAGSVDLTFAKLLGYTEFEPVMQSTVTGGGEKDRDICLVVDRSGSMSWDMSGRNWSYPRDAGIRVGVCDPPHPTASRWANLVKATQELLSVVDATSQEEQVALVSYSSDVYGCWYERVLAARTEQALTTETSSIRSAMDVLSGPVKNGQGSHIVGGTNIGAGIRSGTQALSGARDDAEKMMVVLTDGVATHGGSPVSAAREAASEGIVLHAVTFSRGANQNAMRSVAKAGGGQHYHATDLAALIKIFRQLGAGGDGTVFID